MLFASLPCPKKSWPGCTESAALWRGTDPVRRRPHRSPAAIKERGSLKKPFPQNGDRSVPQLQFYESRTMRPGEVTETSRLRGCGLQLPAGNLIEVRSLHALGPVQQSAPAILRVQRAQLFVREGL